MNNLTHRKARIADLPRLIGKKTMTITNINHITLAVTNIHRAFSFYKDILGFKPLVKWDQGAYFLIGDFWFCLNVDELREP